MIDTQGDWLLESLAETRRALDELPESQKRAFEKDLAFQRERKRLAQLRGYGE